MPCPRIYNIAALGGGGGGGTTGNENFLSQTFSFSEVSPKKLFTVPAGWRVVTCQLILDIPFNDPTATLTIGDLALADRYMKATENVPNESGENESNPYYPIIIDTDIYITINKGLSIQGQGLVIMELDKPV